jgi:predicted O-methyltransferase YrrM
MNEPLWTSVDDYLSALLAPPDAALEGALARSDAAGLPAINVTPNQGKLLHLLAKAQGARSILEIGTLGGYSTIWLARALPAGGRLVTLESEPKHAEVARANFLAAGLSDVIDLRLGRAIEILPQLAAANRGPFDFIFIDADKPSTPDYFTWALRLARPGSVIVVDNVVRKGAIVEGVSDADPGQDENENANIAGVRRFLEMAAAEPRVSVTAIQTVGSKGYDGFALAMVLP